MDVKEKTALKKKKRKLIKKKSVLYIIGAIVIIYFVYILISQQVSIGSKNKEIKALQSEIDQASAETEKLQKQVDNLQDPEYIEKIAREKLGLVRPNERVYVDANKSEDNSGK